MKLKILSLLLAVGALVSACGDDDNGTGPENSGRLRIVHLAPTAPDVDVLVDDVEVATNAPYLAVSDYLEVEAGSRDIAIRVSNSDVVLEEEDVTVADGVDYTVLVVGEPDEVSLDVLTDDNTAPAAGNARVRLVHGSPGAGLVDIYVTDPGTDIELVTPDLTAVAFGEFSPYIEVPAGDYRVRITPTGTTDPVIDETLTLSSGQVRTGIAVDAPGGGAPFDALILEDLN